MKILAVTLSLLHLTLALHCWKDDDACRGDTTSKFGSNCDTSNNRIKDMRVFRNCLKGFCSNDSLLRFRVRPQDGPMAKPSGAVCDGNFHSSNASLYGDHLASCVSDRYPQLIENFKIVCCEAGLNEGCK